MSAADYPGEPYTVLRKIATEPEHAHECDPHFIYSVFCEWAYIANVDTGKLEVYEGSCAPHHARGRYRLSPEDVALHALSVKHYELRAIHLLATYPLQAVPENWDKDSIFYEPRR